MLRCEHCNSICHLAQVCGRCGREHGVEWYRKAADSAKSQRIFWILTIIYIPIFCILFENFDMEIIIFLVFISGGALPVISDILTSRFPPKSIILSNGKSVAL